MSQSYFEIPQSKELSIAIFFGLIFTPLLAERIFSNTAKSINNEFELAIKRRDPNFKGEWLLPYRDGRILRISYNNLAIKATYLNSYNKKLENIPGFNKNNRSLLSKCFPLCNEPGEFIRSMQLLYYQLSKGDTQDLDWAFWLSSHFSNDKPYSEYSEELQALNEIKKIIKSNDIGIEFLDILMFAQLNDCYTELGLA